ncbi:MAG TPA: methyltransferase type 11 [Fibrobacteres bacterium]|jgi:ubiquinone/menaquinone biosynthesis C-methylase UbiE|nr:methyltransferase type 11 [Fibrobacterota bacterium]
MKKNLILYDVHTFGADFDREIKRLDAQVNLFWNVESEYYKRVGVGNCTALVDLGCGTGRLLKHLADLFPDLTLTGVETDASLIDIAKFAFAGNGRVPSFINSSVQNTMLPDALFDVAVLRLVLEHLPDPDKAILEARRILKPGGKIIAIDNDFDFHVRTWPGIPKLDDYYMAYCAARERQGGHPRIGRRLPELLLKAGFLNVNLDVLCAHNKIVGDELFLQSEGQNVPLQLVKTGWFDDKTFFSMKKNWAAMFREPDHVIVRPMFYAVGEVL